MNYKARDLQEEILFIDLFHFNFRKNLFDLFLYSSFKIFNCTLGYKADVQEESEGSTVLLKKYQRTIALALSLSIYIPIFSCLPSSSPVLPPIFTSLTLIYFSKPCHYFSRYADMLCVSFPITIFFGD